MSSKINKICIQYNLPETVRKQDRFFYTFWTVNAISRVPSPSGNSRDPEKKTVILILAKKKIPSGKRVWISVLASVAYSLLYAKCDNTKLKCFKLKLTWTRSEPLLDTSIFYLPGFPKSQLTRETASMLPPIQDAVRHPMFRKIFSSLINSHGR